MARKEYPNSPSAGLVNFDQCIAKVSDLWSPARFHGDSTVLPI